MLLRDMHRHFHGQELICSSVLINWINRWMDVLMFWLASLVQVVTFYCFFYSAEKPLDLTIPIITAVAVFIIAAFGVTVYIKKKSDRLKLKYFTVSFNVLGALTLDFELMFLCRLQKIQLIHRNVKQPRVNSVRLQTTVM